MAKTTASLTKLSEAGLPFISILTDPTPALVERVHAALSVDSRADFEAWSAATAAAFAPDRANSRRFQQFVIERGGQR